jgi:hypothetical protein
MPAQARGSPRTVDWIAGASPMMDVIVLAIGFVFFAVSIGYVHACDRL